MQTLVVAGAGLPSSPETSRVQSSDQRKGKGWEERMPNLTVEGVGTFEVPHGKRLVLALADEGGIDQLHACGGNAKCTTCRVEFVAGEPQKMTSAERQVLAAKGLSGMRLSCQLTCENDMEVVANSRLTGSTRKDVGPRPTDEMAPDPVWEPLG